MAGASRPDVRVRDAVARREVSSVERPWPADQEDHDRLRDWHGSLYHPDDVNERFTRRAVAAIAIRHHAERLAY